MVLVGLQLALQASPVAALGEDQRRVFDSGARYVNTSADCDPTSSGYPTSNGTNNVYVIGDSLTVGMNRDSLGEQNLDSKLRAAGWNPTIKAQGCRPLYNSSNPDGFQGDGSACPSGLITDAFLELENDTVYIERAAKVIVALGTNRYESDEAVFRTKIAEYVTRLSIINPSLKPSDIYWVNLYVEGGSRDARSDIINAEAAILGFNVIDFNAEVKQNTAAYPFADGTHHTDAGYIAKNDFVVDEFGSISSGGGGGGGDLLSLRYPNFPNVEAAISGTEQYILSRFPSSPFASNLQYVRQIFDGSARADINVNPLLVMAIARQENGFGQAASSATANNNYFGITSATGYPTVNDYAKFPSVEEGIDYFVNKVGRHVADPQGPYEGLSNFYEYLSIHQVGLIAYPGEYPDNAPGKDADPPYLTYDHRMDVYTSWDVTRNSHRSGWDPETNPLLYNPGIYYENSINMINEIMGTSLSTQPTPGANVGGGGAGLCGDDTSIPGSGPAAEYIPDCGANGGNAAIACTAINQLMGIEYSQPNRAAADAPDPVQYLDCSALTGMALYRTFGVNLGGICSTAYTTHELFEPIEDLRTIQPGDFIGKGTGCASGGGGGHIALVVSYDPDTKKLITVETGSTRYLSGLRGIGGDDTYNVGLAIDGNGSYTWAVRYVGTKNLQPGAM